MKKVNVIAVAVAAAFGGTAFAATSQAVAVKSPAKKAVAQKKISKKVISTKANQQVASASVTASNTAADVLSTSRSSATAVSMPTTGTTTTSAAAVQPAAAKKSPFSAKVNFYYYGSSLEEPFRPYQTDQSSMNGYRGSPVSLETHIALGYKLTNNLTLSLNPYFDHTPNYTEDVLDSNGNKIGEKAVKGDAFRLTQPFIRLGVGQFLKVGKFKWNGDFRVYPGISDFTSELGLPLYLRNGHNFMYSATDKLTLAAYNTIRYYKYNSSVYDKKPATRDFRLTSAFGPEYQVNDAVGLSALYIVDVRHPNNAGIGFREWQDTPDGAYAELGVSWDINKMFNFNPYVDFYLQNAKFYNTMIGANLAITLL